MKPSMIWRGENLERQIEHLGYTRTSFAVMVGVSLRVVAEWLEGKIPKGYHLMKICEVLDVSPAVFFHKVPADVEIGRIHSWDKHGGGY